MIAVMEEGIEGIDPRRAASSLFLASVKPVPKGDGFRLPEEWINGGRIGAVRLRPDRGGAQLPFGPRCY